MNLYFETGEALGSRHMMSLYLGRPLESWEHVHHCNGDVTDNRLDNLELTSRNHHLTDFHSGENYPTERSNHEKRSTRRPSTQTRVFTEKEARLARELRRCGVRIKTIARVLEIPVSRVRTYVTGIKKWEYAI